MSKVLEIQRRLEAIDRAEFFPSACIDIAEKLIRRTTSVEFNIIGSIELAWRRGFQAGEESAGLRGVKGLFDSPAYHQLVAVLEDVAVRDDMMLLDEGSIMEPIGKDTRRLAADLLEKLEALERGGRT